MSLFEKLVEKFDPSVLGDDELVVQVRDTTYLREEKSDFSANKVGVAILGAKRGIKVLPSLPWPGVILLEEGKLWISQEELTYFSDKGAIHKGYSKGCRFVLANDSRDILERSVLFRRPHNIIAAATIDSIMYDVCDENPAVIYSGGAYNGGGQGRIVTWTEATRAHVKTFSNRGLVLMSNLTVCVQACNTSEPVELYRVPGFKHNGDFQLGAGAIDGKNLYVTLYELRPGPRTLNSIPLMRLDLYQPNKLETMCDLVTGKGSNNKPEGVEQMRVKNIRVYFVPYGSPDKLCVQEVGGKVAHVVLEAKGLHSIDDFAVYQRGDLNI